MVFGLGRSRPVSRSKISRLFGTTRRGLSAEGLATRRRRHYVCPMGTMHPVTDDDAPVPRQETAEERRERLAWEAERIAEARADVAAGRVVSAEAVNAWIDSLGTDQELPPPRSGR